ncbi:methyltransferase domain-containing protein [Dinoroseobacter sp. S76]|uniref:methyltransferase domain-containing protein n=1 Tax=Dinoroseobacter sp. S76 TaxID=3415124 RepID=UPI003C7E4A86
MSHLAGETRDPVELYSRLAPSYDLLHRRWLKYAGGEAQAALEAAVRVAYRPGAALLDVGCGTGVFARTLLSEGVAAEDLTLLDPSAAMLNRCADLPCPKVPGRLEALPFPSARFEIVTCAWALETSADAALALQELCRVLRPGGALCLAFCADKPARGPVDWMMRQALLRRGTGRFLCVSRVVDLVAAAGAAEIRVIPLAGPVAALVARGASAATRLGCRSDQARPAAA